jgi:hypothetical protein
MRASFLMTTLRFLTWGFIILLAALSLLPVRAFAALSLLPALGMVRGVIPAPVGHFVAYAVAGALAMIVYVQSWGAIQITGGVWVYAGILEYLQHFSPGRYPSIVEFIGSALRALCGGLAVTLIWRLRLDHLRLRAW